MSLSVVETKIAEMLAAYVAQNPMSVDDAASSFQSVWDEESLARAVEALKERQRGYLVRPPAVTDRKSYHDKGWYLGSKSGGHWSYYLDQLGDTFGLEQLDEETHNITALLANPLARESKRKGLVMGNVQSGKTRNYAGVVAKAVDAGYRFVIILAGVHNNLRSQTQDRLDSQLFTAPGWYPLTTSTDDFSAPNKPKELFRHQKAICAVVKKNPTRLKKLNRMLTKDIGPEVLRNWPVLIIDDEADQASPNSLAQKGKIATINGHLRDLWETVQTGTYVAYTATPFANVLIPPDDERDLFPSDFVTTIAPGAGYFGAERVFGLAETVEDADNGTDGLNMVRQIPTEEADSLKPSPDPEIRAIEPVTLPKSLKEAVDWFVVATAIRRARGQHGHSSMLVHTTHNAMPHFTMRDALMVFVGQSAEEVEQGDFARYEQSWERERLQVQEVATKPLPTWEQVKGEIPGVLEAIEGIVDNGKSKDRLSYDEDNPRTVIAVGGGTLSRGLTLEGLVVSYFTRTSNSYDTLLQMGRWFGYRPGYEDLPRIWVTEGLDDDYAFLARVESDLRAEIATVADSEFTPRQLGVRIRCHPGRLMVTAQNKMYDAMEVQLGLSGVMNQTFLLDAKPGTLAYNQSVVDAMLAGCQLATAGEGSAVRYLTSGISGARVRRLIKDFRVADEQKWLSEDQRNNIVKWIQDYADGPQWNVLLVSGKDSDREEFGSLRIADTELVCLNRAPMEDSTAEKINMKAVVSRRDLLADLDLPEGGTDDDKWASLRRRYGRDQGLVVIYPLSRKGKAKPVRADQTSNRIDMQTEEDLLAFAVVYPHVNDDSGEQGTFISVRRNWSVPETVEGDEDQDLDETEDE